VTTKYGALSLEETMKLRVLRLLAVASVPALVFAACGDDDDDDAGSSTTEAPAEEPTLEGDITVFAAASLTDAFTELGTTFESENPDASVEFNFGASSALREQILAGAPADVFASANTSNMDQVVDGGAANAPEDFVTNLLEIAVPAGNEAGVTGLDDFANPDLLIGLCADEVPCGEFGREALANAGVTPSIDTNEPDVRSLLTKVEAGDLDAGIVYVTDVMAAGDTVEGVDIPADENVIATYPIAALTDTANAEVTDAFVEFVLSDEGQEILQSFGFDAP
jgi:molybdate transport system substrate-binding protein